MGLQNLTNREAVKHKSRLTASRSCLTLVIADYGQYLLEEELMVENLQVSSVEHFKCLQDEKHS